MGQPKETLWPSEPRTLVKHQVYRHYLGCWMGKICGTFPSATIVDAFAGPGRYSDGPDGSPLVIAKTFTEHSQVRRFKHLRLLLLEERQDRRDHLQAVLADLAVPTNLEPVVLPAADVNDRVDSLVAEAHSKPGTPVLWILDPFDYSSVPFTLLEQCLRGRRDEVLLTWFADELYRFRDDATKHRAFDRHFGDGGWRAGRRGNEEAVKATLLSAYEERVQSLKVFTRTFLMSSKNEAARYAFVFATHDQRGLDCFNPVAWKLDRHSGRKVNEFRTNQLGLFDDTPDVDRLRDELAGLAGRAVAFDQLHSIATRLGFTDKHLRQVLHALAQEGRAAREQPLKARTAWPEGCLVRFYPPRSADSEAALT